MTHPDSGDGSDVSRRLPPLILHPFAKSEDTERLMESSRLTLLLADGRQPEDDETLRKLLICRYHEIRMLYFIGKDIFRWMDQCVDFVERDPELDAAGIRHQSFADFLTSCPPVAVREKMKQWGVTDYQVLFSRAIGLNGTFGGHPGFDWFSVEFLRNYHRYADALYGCFRQSAAFRPIAWPAFDFEVFASGEYSSMLEKKWME